LVPRDAWIATQEPLCLVARMFWFSLTSSPYGDFTSHQPQPSPDHCMKLGTNAVDNDHGHG
jgi:hypothetical protein